MPPSLELSFDRLEAGWTRARKVVATAARACSAGERAAQSGDIRAAATAESIVESSLVELRETLASLQTNALADHLRAEMRRGQWAREVADLVEAARPGLAHALDGEVHAFPILVQPMPDRAEFKHGARRFRSMRPSVVAKMIIELQRPKASNATDTALPAIKAAYTLLARGETSPNVSIDRLYDTMTLAPGSRDVFPLHHMLATLVVAARQEQQLDGMVVRISGATATHGGRGHRLVDESGAEVVITAIRFE